MADGGLARWIGVAVVIHAAALVGVRGHIELPNQAPSGPATALIEIAEDPPAAVAKAPEPEPPAPALPRLADMPGTSMSTVNSPKPARPSDKPPVPATPSPRDPVAAQLVKALSAVAAEASKILASTEGDGPPIASGDAVSAYGMVAGNGSGSSPTFDARAGLRGRPGGTGAPVPEPPDRSRGAAVNRGYDTECEFPAEADREHINHGWAELIVTVRPDGRAARVQLLADSGYGFGRVAQQCSMHAHYRPALDRSGHPVERNTPSFRYGFHR
jgi:hypothetical protein